MPIAQQRPESDLEAAAGSGTMNLRAWASRLARHSAPWLTAGAWHVFDTASRTRAPPAAHNRIARARSESPWQTHSAIQGFLRGVLRGWGGWGPNPRPADYENYGPVHRTHYLHGYHGTVPPMALIALYARVARSTNRSTLTMATAGCQLQNVTARLVSACPGPAA